MTNPADGRSKALVLLGRDANELKSAADALVLATKAFSGASVQVKGLMQSAPRAAYDAPAWVKLDRPEKLGELIDWAQQLETSGRPPALDPIGVDLRMPPDLVVWRGPGVPLDLRFQYTPPACAADAHLDVTINDELLKEIALRTEVEGGQAGARAAPKSIPDSSDVMIPAYRLRARNQLKFAFRFGMRDDAQCRDARPESVKALVSPDSTIDFSGFPHYAQMPNLGYFASVGFPFTRYADLSQTAFILPDPPAVPDIEVLLGLAARLGEATGQPATGVRVASETDAAKLIDADLIVIGASPQLGLLDKWNQGLPAILSGKTRRVSGGASSEKVFEGLVFGEASEAALAEQVSLEGDGPLTAFLGFESPLTPGRSVVAVTASRPVELVSALDALEGSDSRRAIRGGAAFIRAGKVESALAPRAYAIGEIPWNTGLAYRITSRPILALTIAGALLLALFLGAWQTVKAISVLRGRGKS
jgi:hypothetical protein